MQRDLCTVQFLECATLYNCMPDARKVSCGQCCRLQRQRDSHVVCHDHQNSHVVMINVELAQTHPNSVFTLIESDSNIEISREFKEQIVEPILKVFDNNHKLN